MPLGVFCVFVAFPLAMAAAALFAGLRARRRAALIKATHTSNIAMASDGYCELEGSVEAIGGQTLSAPLSGSPCVWYHARLEQWVRRTAASGKSSWSTVRDETSRAPFFVRDSTGVCTVHPDGAEITPTDKSQWTGATLVPTDRNPPRLGPGESTTGMFQVSGLPGSGFRYFEERIYAGNPLFVLGEFSQGRFEPPDLVDETDEKDEAAADEPLEPQEPDPWDDFALTDRLREQAAQTTTAFIAKGESGKPFILSTTLQAAHVALSDMGGQAALGIAVIPLAVAALMLYARFG